MKYYVLIFLVVALYSCKTPATSDQNDLEAFRIDLSGDWTLRLDSLNIGENEKWFAQPFNDQKISLPGTLDDAGIGTPDTLTPALNNYVLSNLTRKHEYIGKAWYQKQIAIPENWSDKEISLTLERVMWGSTVYIDDEKVDSQESLVGSHTYDLDEHLLPGSHTLTIMVDNSNLYPNINVTGNRYPNPVNREMAHGYTNHTQIKWNGILGDMLLKASEKPSLTNLQLYPDPESQAIEVVFEYTGKNLDGLEFEIFSPEGNLLVSQKIEPTLAEGNSVSFTLEKPDCLEFWDEFNPVLYKAVLRNGSEYLEQPFGYRNVSNVDGQLHLNGHRIFLRGNLENVIFPLTGHPPMTTEGWAALYKQAKNYGLNHIRFHSWCPPKAAFEAADEAGIYLQVELPHWSLKAGEDAKTNAFLQKEAAKIINDYGQHPSFLFFAMGNELEGDFDFLNKMVANLKQKDPRHLYATTSYSFQKPAGRRPEPEDEFFITQHTEKGWVRGQGIFNSTAPNFNKDYTSTSEHINIPLISHEIGQYSVYPDLSEIKKYTGVLKPLNFIAVKNDLQQKGLIDLAPQFTQASGNLAAMLYKEEIERALKTSAFDGFQLLQLQDFPGQGTALVGLLNAFWESKGIISGDEFREFNSPLVPLVRFEKAIYESGEPFKAQLEVANFLKDLEHQTLHAVLKDSKGEILKEVVVKDLDLPLGNNMSLGELQTSVDIEQADVWTLELNLEGTDYKNSWPIWVYPKGEVSPDKAVVVTQSFEEAVQSLEAGKTVLLNPNIEDLNGIEGRFVPVFWSPVHFPDQPGTMGFLIDKESPALAHFPTETYTQWQWWDLAIQSKSLNLDNLGIQPIVRVIDNFVTNHDLANLFEARVGEGKLLFSSMDLHTELEKRPAARQLRKSILQYISSDEFNPTQKLDKRDLLKFKSE